MTHVGEHVWYNVGGEDEIGHFVKEGADKDTIQTVDGSRKQLAYREPADRDDQGSGVTWWKIK